MLRNRASIRVSLVVSVLCALGSSLAALSLDWDTVVWTAGSLSNEFDTDPFNAGNDIRIQITGNTAFNESGYPGELSDAHGLSPAQQSLRLWYDWSSETQSVTVTITFLYAQGVSNVNFLLFDVDRIDNGRNPDYYRDQIRNINASFSNGTPFGPTAITPSNSSYIGVSGSDTNQVINANNPTDGIPSSSGAANVKLDWGSQTLTRLTFTYINHPSVQADPVAQFINLHDIHYNPVPEPATLAALTLGALAASSFRTRRRI